MFRTCLALFCVCLLPAIAGAVTPAPPKPLLPSGPDPWVIARGGIYYYMHTLGDRIALMDSGALKGIYAPAEFLQSTDAFVQPYVTAFRARQQILNSGA